MALFECDKLDTVFDKVQCQFDKRNTGQHSRTTENEFDL